NREAPAWSPSPHTCPADAKASRPRAAGSARASAVPAPGSRPPRRGRPHTCRAECGAPRAPSREAPGVQTTGPRSFSSQPSSLPASAGVRVRAGVVHWAESPVGQPRRGAIEVVAVAVHAAARLAQHERSSVPVVVLVLPPPREGATTNVVVARKHHLESI